MVPKVGLCRSRHSVLRVPPRESPCYWSAFVSTAFIGAQVPTLYRDVRSAVTEFIIAPLSGAVNTFASFGDQLAKTSRRVGIGAETLDTFNPRGPPYLRSGGRPRPPLRRTPQQEDETKLPPQLRLAPQG